jgi:hypothetical protein
MTSEDDLAYFVRRANDASERAARATDPLRAKIHSEFARNYGRHVLELRGKLQAKKPRTPAVGA